MLWSSAVNAVWTSDGGKPTGNCVGRCKHSIFKVEMFWNICCMARHAILFDSVSFSSANFSSLRCNCYQAVGVESLMTCPMLLFGIFCWTLHSAAYNSTDQGRWTCERVEYICFAYVVFGASPHFHTKINPLQVNNNNNNNNNNLLSVQYSVDFITAFRKLYVLITFIMA
jgi:hypothetical protein